MAGMPESKAKTDNITSALTINLVLLIWLENHIYLSYDNSTLPLLLFER